MSNYSTSIKRKVSTSLDNAGQILNLSRLENESLVDYRERLIDHVLNRGTATDDGLNFSFAREAGLQRKHVITIEAIAGVEKSLIEVTSKYLRLFDGDFLDLEVDLYTNTIGNINTLIEMTSTRFITTYFDDDYQNESAKKLFYGDNIKWKQVELLGQSKLNRLDNTYIKSITFSSDKHRFKKSLSSEVISIHDYFIDMAEGLIYTGQNSSDTVNYLYYEIPFKLFYTPISFYPLNDKDIDEIIKDSVLTENGEEFLLINSQGAEYINELLQTHPLTFGK